MNTNAATVQELRIDNASTFETIVRNALQQDDLELFKILFLSPPLQTIHCKERNISIQIVDKSVPRNVNMVMDSLTGNCLLMVAIQLHCDKIVEYLLQEFKPCSQVCGSQPLQTINYKNSIQSNCLHIAANCGNLEAAVHILNCSKFTGKNDRDLYGNHAMHLAAAKGYHDMMRLMVSVYKLEVNCKRGTTGKTPLFVATENNDVLGTKILLEELGAMYNARDNENRTAVMMMAGSSETEFRTKLITLMLQHDMESLCKTKDKSRQTVLHKCAQTNHIKFLRTFALVVPVHLYAPIVNEPDRLQNTPLHYAVLYQGLEVVECLLLMGADVRSQNIDGNTPLHLAAILLEKNNNSITSYQICKILYEKENTGLMNKNMETTDFLLQHAHFYESYFNRKVNSAPSISTTKRKDSAASSASSTPTKNRSGNSTPTIQPLYSSPDVSLINQSSFTLI